MLDVSAIDYMEEFITCAGNYYSFKEVEIMHWIGKDDINGKPIYEHDLVMILYPDPYQIRNNPEDVTVVGEKNGKQYAYFNYYSPIEVVWNQKNSCFKLNKKKSKMEHNTFSMDGTKMSLGGKTFFITGNTFENA